MPCTVLMGTQWGDEGKGKITDLLAKGSDAVVRYQGGNNAGHTIVVKGRTFKLHIIPSGVLREGQLAIIGDGCVVDPWILKREVEYLHDAGISTDGLLLSDRAHLIMPYHKLLDGLQESMKDDGRKVGTTKRGIGPCYQDKAGRTGIRSGDLFHPEILREKVLAGVDHARAYATSLGGSIELNGEEVLGEIGSLIPWLKPIIRDTPQVLNSMLNEGKNILLEGAQGAFLDIDRGTYPFVTSSSCTSGYASAGSGIGPMEIERIVGVVKAYTTRVGEGPFPTELRNKLGERIRERGNEFGTTTERPRRCGWLDLVMVRSSVAWNTITDTALTKVDVISGIDPLMICTEYRLPLEIAEEHGLGTTLRYFPSHVEMVGQAVPAYQKLKGWRDISPEEWEDIRISGDLPRPIRDYISLIEREINANISLLSYGKGREQTIDLTGELQ
ncbi:MAG: adenylosuccinate synthase [Thermoplasmatota archaeon]